MKITIIDNETRFLSELINYAINEGANEVSITKFDNIDSEKLNSSDLILLSGGYKDPVTLHPEKYKSEIDFIRSTQKPILGICMGLELIAYAFGGELERMHNKESKILKLKWTANSPLIDAFNSIEIQEHHRWRIKNLGSDLVSLAESDGGIEVIKHLQRPIYGFQFHPELNDSVNPTVFQKIVPE